MWRGAAGETIAIDGINISIRQTYFKKDLKFSDITYVQWNEPSLQEKGKIIVVTKEGALPYPIFFQLDCRHDFLELYKILDRGKGLSRAAVSPQTFTQESTAPDVKKTGRVVDI